MNACTKSLSLSIVLISAFGFTLGQPLPAQTFTLLHDFNGADGASPNSLISWGNVLYGAAESGGASSKGTIFAVHTDGTGFTTLHDFAGAPNDGSDPYKGLVMRGGTLWGTTFSGGTRGLGTVFSVNTNGTGFSILYSFTGGGDGGQPVGVLFLSDTTLYGQAWSGALAGIDPSGNGTIFAINPDGSGFKTLYSFHGGIDGAAPNGGVILSGNTLYGTASEGGNTIKNNTTTFAGNGTVFALNTNGTGFKTLHAFTLGSGLGTLGGPTNSDGAGPKCVLVLSGNTLFGTSPGGGTAGNGTIFSVETNGSGFTTLYNFSPLDADTGTTNSDGAGPAVGLVLSGDTLYGTTASGGTGGNGTIFAIKTNGTGFTTLYSFTATSGSPGTNSDGAVPYGGVILWGNKLYGSARSGGTSGNGTIFSLSLGPASPPALTIVPSAGHIVLTWPTSAVGFNVQSATNLTSSAWSVVSQPPVVVNSRNTLTNPITGTPQFFRLSQ